MSEDKENWGDERPRMTKRTKGKSEESEKS